MDRIRGFNWGNYYNRFQREDLDGIPHDTTIRLLNKILTHCQQTVPYYREYMRKMGGSFKDDPYTYLLGLPILTKDIIRSRFDELKSSEINKLKWRFESTGGSSGESLKFIADYDHSARAFGVTMLCSKLMGKDEGEKEILLWGSPRDVKQRTRDWKAHLIAMLSNHHLLNAFQMTPERMKEFINTINIEKPKLITAYADALYELARFADYERLEVVPQNAASTSAGMLHPYMRQEIEKIFRCRVFNRYGSREFGTIACERPGCEGLWVPPWTIYIEIVDDDGYPVPFGTEGEILVTSLTNFAMPFIRYRIGDRGVLSSRTAEEGGIYGQVFNDIHGRDSDIFRTKNGAIIHASYFAYMLYFRDWIKQYQVIQKSYSMMIFRIVKSGSECSPRELNDITERTKMAMGGDCEVYFDFVDEISRSSDKYRYFISEVARREKAVT
jgi:phenylacetate-CoA ligase